jgi:hypothetical protein
MSFPFRRGWWRPGKTGTDLFAHRTDERHFNAICPVITDIWTDIHSLHCFPVNFPSLGGFPVHSQRDLIVIRGGTDEEDISRIADPFVIGGGKYPVRRKDTPAVAIGKPFSPNADGQIL